LISLDEAITIINREVDKLPARSVPILDSAGCELREDIVSPLDVPTFANSAMDGYAIRHSDLEGDGPWRFPIQEVIAAGDLSKNVLENGYAAKIMTGAPLPQGADTVIIVEDVSVDSGQIVFKEKPETGTNVRPAGDDIEKGQTLYKAGEPLDPVAIGVLASIGRSEVRVTPKPKVAVLSTGSELANPGQELSGGKIYNSNDFIVKSLLKKDGLEISAILKTSFDNIEELCSALTGELTGNDLVIASGGVSMGDFDLVPEAVKRLGGLILFHKVFIKPGKPVLLAKINDRWLLGLPGNPVSVFVGYHLYARRIMARLGGLEYNPRTGKAILGADLPVKGERHYIVGTRIDESASGVIAHPAPSQQSGRLYSIAGVNGFIFVQGGTRIIEKGAEVDIEWLE
jgi:molybdopterin molybdotransferase